MLGMLPAGVQAPAIEMFSRKGSLVASNVPGPQSPLYLCGQRIVEMYFWVPQSGSIGIGVSILSYAGKVFFGHDRRPGLHPGAAAAGGPARGPSSSGCCWRRRWAPLAWASTAGSPEAGGGPGHAPQTCGARAAPDAGRRRPRREIPSGTAGLLPPAD